MASKKKHKKEISAPPGKARNTARGMSKKKTPAVYIYFLCFTSGMSVMAMELAASRLYAPYFGTSVFVWAGLIGALLLFLACGYYLGGRQSRGGAGAERLFFLALAGSLLAAAVPYIARPVMVAISGATGLGGNMLPGVAATSAASLAAPLVLFGSVLPLATGILARDSRDAGATAGVLYALSTAGSIAGVFLPVLVTLPLVGTRLTFLIFAAPPAIAAAAGLARARWFLVLFLFIPFGMFAHRLPIKPAEPGTKLIAERETRYGYARIAENGGTIYMSVDQGWFMYSMLKPGEIRTDSYRDYFPIAKLLTKSNRAPRRVCILGAAGGADARVLKHAFPGVRITGVEIDSGLVDLGAEYMGLRSVTDRIVVADGRDFIRTNKERYDLVIVDVYNQTYIPFHMATVEFYRLVRARLAPGGVVAFNVAWRWGDDWTLVRRCADTLRAVFPSVYLKMFENRANTLLFATADAISEAEVGKNIEENGNAYVRTLTDETRAVFERYEGGGEPLTDDLAPVEYLTDITIAKIVRLIKLTRV